MAKSYFFILLAIEAGKDPELCRLPAPVEARRKSDHTIDGAPGAERPNSLAITARPRPRPLSSPSSGSESPAGIRRFPDQTAGSESYTTPTNSVAANNQPVSSSLSQAIVTVQSGPYQTNPYLDGVSRGAATYFQPANTGSPNLGNRATQNQRNTALQTITQMSASAHRVSDEPSPFDQVKFPPPINHIKRLQEANPSNLPKKSVRFSPNVTAKSGKVSYQTQRSLLDENMGEEQDIHNPLLSSEPLHNQVTVMQANDHKTLGGSLNVDELVREFLP